jgi:hypothetical protein
MSKRNKTEREELVTVAPGFAWTTVKGAMFVPGLPYRATVNEGRSLFNLTHPQTGEVVSFTLFEVAACAA